MDWETVVGAVAATYDDRFGLEPAELDIETLELARRLAPEHVPAVDGTSSG